MTKVLNMKSPRVGIFMPAYNQGKYIHEALESLKNQSFQDFKVHIVDDASTDDITIPILKKIDYSKAELFLNDSNVGVQTLARRHFKLLGTEYIFVLCADDLIDEKYIESTVSFLDKNPDIGAVSTWIQYFGESTDTLQYDKTKCKLPDMLVENNFLGSSLVRSAALESIGWGNTGDSKFRIHNDWDRWVSILSNGYRLGMIEEPLFMYRILSNSLSHGASVENELTFRKAFFEKHHDLFMENIDFILESTWKKMITTQRNYRDFSKGHEWLDAEYKKQLSLLASHEKEIDLLRQQKEYFEASSKWSIYPSLRRIKHLFFKS